MTSGPVDPSGRVPPGGDTTTGGVVALAGDASPECDEDERQGRNGGDE